MRFEWDEEKNRRNLAKHKISFGNAGLAFDDPRALSVQDCVVEGEERWQTLGMVSGIVVIVAHTWREGRWRRGDPADFGAEGNRARKASVCRKSKALKQMKSMLSSG